VPGAADLEQTAREVEALPTPFWRRPGPVRISPGPGVTAGSELRGKHVVLVPVTAEHVPELRRILRTPEVWLRWGDEAASPQWPFGDPSATRFAVLLDGAVRGMVQYCEEEPAYRHASIDVFLDPRVHGRGIGRDTVGTLARHLVHEVRHCWLMDDVYLRRLDALEQIWQVWAQLGDSLTEEQWSAATRCPGWDVAAVYAHYSAFPLNLSTLPPPSDSPIGEPVTAVEILRRFNAPDGVAHTMAGTVADGAVTDAAAHTRRELADRFRVHGPRALNRLRHTKATAAGPWPHSGAVITPVEALRIVLLEATVHLLDIQRALDHPPAVPKRALQDTVQLLAELAPAVELIEAATGRSPHSPLPVM
jgi:uncharacterized protein (TIGR03083 family)